MARKTKWSRRSDMHKRSREDWERGDFAPKKSNPRYKPKRVRRRDGVMTTVYVLRKKEKKPKKRSFFWR